MLPAVGTATGRCTPCSPVNPTPKILLRFVGWVDGSWVEGQAGVGQEPDHQVLMLADPLDALVGGVGDLGQRGRG
jgi:hypothetical protein